MAGGDTSTGADHKARIELAIEEVLSRDPQPARYTTIYGGSKSGIEFTWARERYLVIPVWQGVGGTVDEKFPFIANNSRNQSGYDHVVIITGGKGARPGALKWLQAESIGTDSPRITVLGSAEDFRGACQRANAHGTRLFD